VIHVMKENHKGEGNLANFSLTLMLAIAYASNLGGISTIIGTPPNVAYVGYINKEHGFQIPFLHWMLICTPLAILLLACLYLVTVKLLFPNRIKSDHSTKQLIHDELQSLGPLSRAEKRVLVIFCCTALLWITRDIINNLQSLVKLDDTIIAVIGAVALFICPAGNENDDQVLEWGDTKTMAWGILLLFGGGLSLAAMLERAGLIKQLGEWLAQFAGNGLILVFVVSLVSIFISEVMSNIAQVIVFAPVVTSLAIAVHMNPLVLGFAMTLSASCASMLPMGTPPNAIVFASGHIKLPKMIRAGLVMNIIAVILISLFCWFILPLLLPWK
jgi:solute carrier family 13 (sodium-dependent dicarboxylate transporter), member 2/3/5